MRKYALLLTALAVSLAFAATASATQVSKQWICHGTGSATNPYVLINVPTNSAHFTKHLPDGDDLAVGNQQNPSCPGGQDQPPVTKPFTGSLTFSLDAAKCDEGEQGVAGFTVTMETYYDGELKSEQVVFVFPPTCITTGAGPAGANGANGANGADGANGANGATTTTVVNTTTPVKSCVSHRRFSLYLPVKALRHAKTVRVTVAGKVYRMHPNKAGRVRISLVGLTRGIYAVVVQTPKGVKGVDPKTGLTRAGFFARSYTVCGAGNLTALNVPTRGA
jgi:hypothetical protein